MTNRLAGGLPRTVLAVGLLIVVGLARPGAAMTAVAAADTAHCVDAATLDLRRLLPPPPPAGSARERAELDELLHLQSMRTPREAQLAQRDVERSIFRFANALGDPPAFNAAHLPLTTALFEHLWGDELAVLDPAKRAFARPRPFTVDPRLAPITERPRSLSYPSGHSTWAYTTALVLADMVPERRAQLLARADQYAHNRNIAGVHYPSDVEAGRLAGTALAAMLFTCPAFAHEEAAARRELRRAIGLH